jgi:hypothetical protein
MSCIKYFIKFTINEKTIILTTSSKEKFKMVQIIYRIVKTVFFDRDGGLGGWMVSIETL